MSFIVGFLTPNDICKEETNICLTSNDTVASSGYSIAQMDINTALLVTM